MSPKRVQHRGRVTEARRVPAPVDAAAGLRESARAGLARARVRDAGHRLQQLVDVSPEAAAAFQRVAGMFGVAPGDDDQVVAEVHVDPASCSHGSASGIDMTPPSDPAKVWRCDACGLLHRWTP